MRPANTPYTLLLMTTMLFWLSNSSYHFFLAPTLQSIGASATAIGIAGSVYGLTQLLLRLPVGIAADRYRLGKIFICGGTILAALSGLGMYVLFSVAGFIAFRALSGVASSTWACYAAMGEGLSPDRSKAVASASLLYAANFLGAVTGLVLAGTCAELFGLPSIYLMTFFAGVAAFAASLTLKNSARQHAPAGRRDIVASLKNHHLVKTSVVAAVMQIVFAAGVQIFASAVARDLGAAGYGIALLGLCSSLSFMLTSFLAGKYLLARMSARSVVSVGFFLMAAYCVCVPCVGSLRALYLVQLVGGGGSGLVLPVLTGWCTRDIAPFQKTTAISFFQATYGLGMSVGPLAFGVMADKWGYGVSYVTLAIVAIAAAVAIRGAFRGE